MGYKLQGHVKRFGYNGGLSRAFTWMNVIECDVQSDILSSTNSKIIVENISENVEIGDIFYLTNFDGMNLFTGVISSIEGNEINLVDLYELLNYNIYLKKGRVIKGSCESKLHQLLGIAIEQCDYYDGGSSKKDVKCFDFLSTIDQYTTYEKSSTTFTLLGENNQVNLRDTVFDNANKGFFTYIYADVDKDDMSIKTQKFKQSGKIIDDINGVDNVEIITETAEKTKLLIFDNETSDEKAIACFYLTDTGVTKDPRALNRVKFDKIVCAGKNKEENVNDVYYANMSAELYNHKITLELDYANPRMPFENYQLGDIVRLELGKGTFQTVYTAYAFKFEESTGVQKIKMTFGKVRNKASQKWFQ